MRRQLLVRHESLPLNSPFRISRGAKTTAEVVTVTISVDGHHGRGEGVPYPRYGESVSTSIEAIERFRTAIEGNIDRNELADIMPAGAARNAVDCAMWDLEASLSGTTVAALTGIAPPMRIDTAVTIGIDQPTAMATFARQFRDAATLKVKVGSDDPIAAISAVRAEMPKARMIVDPNESWTFEQLVAWQDALMKLGVDLLEQPLSADADDALAGFTPAIPLAADEAAHGLETLDRVGELYQVINIKLDKTGGLTAALTLARAAQERGLKLMTGCMVSSSLSIAPAAHVAAQSSFVDLDGPLWLKNDRALGPILQLGLIKFQGAGLWGGL